MSTLKIDLAPGCGRKLSTKHVRTSRLKLAELNQHGQSHHWNDSTILSADAQLAMSIDTAVRSLATSADFFRIAVLHAMRDLQASFCNPTDFSLSIRFDDRRVEAELEEFSISISDIAKASGARIGKMHSLLGQGPTEISVSVIGRRLRDSVPIDSRRHSLYILGRVETGEPSENRDWRELLVEGQTIANSQTISFAKDVSGDGLAGALVQMSEDLGLDISLALEEVPYSNASVPLDDCNLDRNMTDFLSEIVSTRSVDKMHRAILMTPQFCGPFLLIMPQGDNQSKWKNTGFVKIGECEVGTGKVEVMN